MLFSILQGDSIQDILINLLLTIPVVILALCVHETAHGYAAYKCGDRTAYNLGRLSLNPRNHLDPLGRIPERTNEAGDLHTTALQLCAADNWRR